MKLQNQILILILCSVFTLIFLCLISQEWTEPVQVSDSDGFHQYPDMCIDHNGVIHIVWAQKISYNFWKIMYSKSENNGETWSEDYDVSQNDTLALLQPHIDNDLVNNLYVTYDYNAQYPSQMSVYMKIFDGNQWSDSILITEGMLGSDYNKLSVINNETAFIGWYRNSKFYYKFYENGVLSQYYCPFCDSTDKFLPVKLTLTSNQIVKWVGASSSTNYSGERLQYFEHNLFNNIWTEPEMVDTNKLKVGLDTDINSNENNEVAYRIQTSVWPNPFSDATLYMFFNGQQWNEPELIVEDPENQQIAIDQNNKVHIVNREKTVTGFQMVHYRKFNNEWIGYVIDSTTYFCHPAKLLFRNNQLFLTYYRNYTPGYPDFNIMFTKYDVNTKIRSKDLPISNLFIYPNPGSAHINIHFELSKQDIVTMLISDFYGRQIKRIINEKIQKGKHTVYWDGKNEQGAKVKSGVYLCRLYCGMNVITKSIEIIN